MIQLSRQEAAYIIDDKKSFMIIRGASDNIVQKETQNNIEVLYKLGFITPEIKDELYKQFIEEL